jgi:hypothetical protein
MGNGAVCASGEGGIIKFVHGVNQDKETLRQRILFEFQELRCRITKGRELPEARRDSSRNAASDGSAAAGLSAARCT